jgi:hypothetical protein
MEYRTPNQSRYNERNTLYGKGARIATVILGGLATILSAVGCDTSDPWADVKEGISENISRTAEGVENVKKAAGSKLLDYED